MRPVGCDHESGAWCEVVCNPCADWLPRRRNALFACLYKERSNGDGHDEHENEIPFQLGFALEFLRREHDPAKQSSDAANQSDGVTGFNDEVPWPSNEIREDVM